MYKGTKSWKSSFLQNNLDMLCKFKFCLTTITNRGLNLRSSIFMDTMREKVYIIYIFRTTELTRMVIWPMYLSFIKIIHNKWFVKFIFCRLCNYEKWWQSWWNQHCDAIRGQCFGMGQQEDSVPRERGSNKTVKEVIWGSKWNGEFEVSSAYCSYNWNSFSNSFEWDSVDWRIKGDYQIYDRLLIAL